MKWILQSHKCEKNCQVIFQFFKMIRQPWNNSHHPPSKKLLKYGNIRLGTPKTS